MKIFSQYRHGWDWCTLVAALEVDRILVDQGSHDLPLANETRTVEGQEKAIWQSSGSRLAMGATAYSEPAMETARGDWLREVGLLDKDTLQAQNAPGIYYVGLNSSSSAKWLAGK